MTNAEKYKTVYERSTAFRKFCGENISKHSCSKCILHDYNVCEFAWLDLEHKEELKKCPFCGGEAKVTSSIHQGCEYHCVECTKCHVRKTLIRGSL